MTSSGKLVRVLVFFTIIIFISLQTVIIFRFCAWREYDFHLAQAFVDREWTYKSSKAGKSFPFRWYRPDKSSTVARCPRFFARVDFPVSFPPTVSPSLYVYFRFSVFCISLCDEKRRSNPLYEFHSRSHISRLYSPSSLRIARRVEIFSSDSSVDTIKRHFSITILPSSDVKCKIPLCKTDFKISRTKIFLQEEDE